MDSGAEGNRRNDIENGTRPLRLYFPQPPVWYALEDLTRPSNDVQALTARFFVGGYSMPTKADGQEAWAGTIAVPPHGLWIWRLASLSANYMDLLQRCAIKRVYLKILNGSSNPVFWSFQCSNAIIKSFNDHGIEVWGWGFQSGKISRAAEGPDAKAGADRPKPGIL
jgi:hypothetical protein